MATYGDLVYGDDNDGWTVSYKIAWPTTSSQQKNNIDYYTDISNYEGPTGASWYQQTWWIGSYHSPYLLVKIFHNTTGIDLSLDAISFLACPAHSNGQRYMASGGILQPCDGTGCKFRARYYVSSNKNEYSETTDIFDVPSIKSAPKGNICRVVGKGAPAVGDTDLEHGPYFGGCGRGYYVGDKRLYPNYVTDTKYGPNKVKLNFKNAITIPDGDYAFLIVEVTDWKDGDPTNQTFVILADSPYFSSTPTTNKGPYIWRMTDLGSGNREWQKTRYAFKWSGTEWIKMTGDEE